MTSIASLRSGSDTFRLARFACRSAKARWRGARFWRSAIRCFTRPHAKQPSIGKLIDGAMAVIEVANPGLKGVLLKNYNRPLDR
jgi:hypothetical protein